MKCGRRSFKITDIVLLWVPVSCWFSFLCFLYSVFVWVIDWFYGIYSYSESFYAYRQWNHVFCTFIVCLVVSLKALIAHGIIFKQIYLTHKLVIHMVPNCIWRWDCSSEYLGIVEYPFFFITPRSDPSMEPQQILLFQVWINRGLMAMKGYSTLSRSSELEPHHQMQCSVISTINLIIKFKFKWNSIQNSSI